MDYSRLTNLNNIEHKDITGTYLEQIATWHNQTPKIWVPNFQASREDIEKDIQRIQQTNPKDLFLGIAVDTTHTLQGFIWAYKQEKPEDSVMILSLYTSKTHRKKGHATQLKLLLEAWCKDEGIKTIETTVHYTNSKMLELNKKLGYTAGMVSMRKTLEWAIQ
ncbi:GNAT family N-acetyltransferase [Fusibacter sp. 3D3]|uniref:GNAT family N-acetyltransferase n=1 Tax=Fusibacter sp. 3D3 TaxID=1048380 RepID=UPI000853DF9E|nr:GNAT family N-acetyltransferase [Fusibacter sp. 3D3]GAU77526.1 hypothetical protein F3D3_2155 [Fusibacter sp. 3D3]